MRHRLYDWLRRHPYFVDAVLVGLFTLALWAMYRNFELDRVTVTTAALLFPLVWRRHYPVAVFTVISLVCALQLVVLRTPLPADAGFLAAVYAVSAYAPRRDLRFAAMAVGVFGSLLGALAWAGRGDGFWMIAAMLATMVALAWTLGDLMRTRRAYVGQLEERARRLEVERDQQARLARSAERTRIAREVHDIIAHSLSIVIAQADGGTYASGQDPAAARRALETIASTGRQALVETRRLLNVLRTEEPGTAGATRPTAGGAAGSRGSVPARTKERAGLESARRESGGLESAGAENSGTDNTESGTTGTGASGTGAREIGETGSGGDQDWAPQPDLSRLGELVERFRSAGLPVELTVRGTPSPMSAGVELAAYRIVQEALTNTLKHGGPAARAAVTLEHRAVSGRPGVPDQAGPVFLRVHVSDDGRGAAAPAPGGGHGIIGMRERAALYGGTLRAGPRPGGGFEVVGEFPCPR